VYCLIQAKIFAALKVIELTWYTSIAAAAAVGVVDDEVNKIGK
jgi:hypothetical protein